MKATFDFSKYFRGMVQEELAKKANYEEEMNAYAACVHDCADFLSEKKFGFVSKYCGGVFFERKGFYPFSQLDNEIGLTLNVGNEDDAKNIKVWKARENDKLARINAEYIAAEKVCLFIDRIHRINSLKLAESNDVRIERIANDYKRILDACIHKGYQAPARRLVREGCCKNVLNLTPEEVGEYLVKIESNYARKAAYNDKGEYLRKKYLFPNKDKESVKSEMMRIRHIETVDNGFLNQVLSGYFGRKVNGMTCFAFYLKLINVFAEVVRSSKSNESVQRHSSLGNDLNECENLG